MASELKASPVQKKYGDKSAFLASLNPLTQEVQQREEMKAANEALISAAKKDQARREGILQQAQTAGRRQAAEGMLQATRGMEVGTGAAAAMGRQAAADTLMQEQQMAAARAAESPEFDMAQLQADVLAKAQAMGTSMTDRVGKMTSYAEIINSYEKGAARDEAIKSLLALEAGQASPDWWVIDQLNQQLTSPMYEYHVPSEAGTGTVGEWYQNEHGQWVKHMPPEGDLPLKQVQVHTGEGPPPGALPAGQTGQWVHIGNGWWQRTTMGEGGSPSTETVYSPGGPPGA